MKKLILIIAIAALVAGCATVGNQSLIGETPQMAEQKITKDVTTKQEVRSLYGDPEDVDFTDSGLEQWRYILRHVKNDAKNFIPFYGMFASKLHINKKQLVVLFNDDGVVKNFTMSSSDSKMKSGIFD